MNEKISLINLIDERIEYYLRKIAYVKKKHAIVVSYNGTSKIALVTFGNDTTQVSLKNLSAETLVAGDVVVVLIANGSNLSAGHIYGKISS